MTEGGAIAALTAAPAQPAKVLVSGGIGTGKTELLAIVRSALRDAGVAFLSRPPRSDQEPGSAFVIDDAHLLADAELQRLTQLVGDPDTTVVIASQPLAHHAALTELTTAMARESPRSCSARCPAGTSFARRRRPWGRCPLPNWAVR